MKNGRILVVLLFVIGLVGTLVSHGAAYPRLLYSAVLLVAVSWLWARLSLRGVTVTRRARSLRASMGDVFEEHFEVENAKRLSTLWVEVSNAAPIPGAAGSRLITSIGGRQKRSYVARTWLTRRGGFPLGPTVLTSGDPFSLFRVQKQFAPADSLIVLPMIYELSSFLSPPGLLPGGKAIRRKALDVTPHAAGIREYVTGDPMKRIHWPTSVRRGQLMVKEFEQDPQAEVWLFLDAQARVHTEREDQEVPVFMPDSWLLGQRPSFSLQPSSFEYAVSVIASLAHYFLQQRRAVGFIAVGQVQTVLPAERSVRQEDKILETLAFLEPKGNMPFASLVSAQARQLPQGSSAILVTPSVRSEILLAVEDLQRRSLRPVVVLLISESFGGYKGGEELARSLMERSVPVCKVYCGADLSQTLSSFSSQPSSQETRPAWISQQSTPWT